MWYETSISTTWKQAKEAIGPIFNHNWIWFAVYSPLPPNPIASIGHPCIFLFEIPTACNVPNRMRFTEVPISTKALLMGIWFMDAARYRALLWSKYPTSMFSSLNVISFTSCKRALSSVAFDVKHSIPAPKAMLTKAFVAILHSFTVSPNWSNRFLNLELFYKVVITAASKASLSSSSSPRSA